MAYRYTPITHSDPTVYADTYGEIMRKVKQQLPDAQHKADDYGEGWVKTNGKTNGYIDQGPLVREF
jgi:hypothetical protein